MCINLHVYLYVNKHTDLLALIKGIGWTGPKGHICTQTSQPHLLSPEYVSCFHFCHRKGLIVRGTITN